MMRFQKMVSTFARNIRKQFLILKVVWDKPLVLIGHIVYSQLMI